MMILIPIEEQRAGAIAAGNACGGTSLV